MLKRSLLLVVAALLVASLSFGAVACGDDDEDGEDGGETPSTQETPSDGAETPAGGETPEATEGTNGEPSAFTTVVATDNPELGTILTTFDGFTLYTFDSDTDGVSTCTADCATAWPPMPAQGEPTAGEGVSGTLGTITRDDGSSQVTLDGAPLYFYSGDAAAGDTNGDGVGGVWHVVILE
jgi:predicted lipoprotein with Yx(FWY)xxD motif